MNHYQILGVTQDATPQQIRTAYKTRVRQVHPDKVKSPENVLACGEDASAAMVAIQTAYTTLIDPAEREHYDNSVDMNPSGPGSDGQANSGGKAGSGPVSDDIVLAWLKSLPKKSGQTKTKMEDLYHDEQHQSTWSRVQFLDRSERQFSGSSANQCNAKSIVFDYNSFGI